MPNVITDYLGEGLHASRPASPSLPSGVVGLWWSSDTTTLSAWDGSAWHDVGGGSAGTPPTVVQVAHENAGGDSVTFGAAPTNGNLLVAMWFNPSVDAVASGWTKVGENSSGSDYGVIATKVAGASESTTQQPINSAPGTGCLVVWEVYGQAASPVVTTATETEQTGLLGTSPILPALTNCLFLGAIGLSSGSNSNNTVYNVTQDVKDTSGTGRQLSAGHSTAAQPTAQIITTFTGSGTPSFKGSGVLITS